MYSQCRNQQSELKQCLISSWFNNVQASSSRQCDADSDSEETISGYSGSDDEQEVQVQVLNCVEITGRGEGRCVCPGPRPRSMWTPCPHVCGCINHQTRRERDSARCYQVLQERDHWSVMAMTKSLTSYMKTSSRIRDRCRIPAPCDCSRNSSHITNISNPCYAGTGYPRLNKYKYETNRHVEHYPITQWIKTGDGKWTTPQRDDYNPPSSCQQFHHESAHFKESDSFSQQPSCEPFRRDCVPCNETSTIPQQLCQSSCCRTIFESSHYERPCLSAGTFTITEAQIPCQDRCPCYSQGSCKENLIVNLHVRHSPEGNQTHKQVAADDCNINLHCNPRWSRYSATFKSLPSLPEKSQNIDYSGNSLQSNLTDSISNASKYTENFGSRSRKKSRLSRSWKSSKQPTTETSSVSKSLERSFKGDNENSIDQENSNTSLQHTPTWSSSTSTSTSTLREEESESNTTSELSQSNTLTNSTSRSAETPLERFLRANSASEISRNNISPSRTTSSFSSPTYDRTTLRSGSKANEDFYESMKESSQYSVQTSADNDKPSNSGSQANEDFYESMKKRSQTNVQTSAYNDKPSNSGSQANEDFHESMEESSQTNVQTSAYNDKPSNSVSQANEDFYESMKESSQYNVQTSAYNDKPSNSGSQANEDFYESMKESSQYNGQTSGYNDTPSKSVSQANTYLNDSKADSRQTTISVNGSEVFRSGGQSKISERSDTKQSDSTSSSDTDSDVPSLVTESESLKRKHHSSERETLEVTMSEDDTPRKSSGRSRRGDSVRKSLLSVSLIMRSSSSSSTNSSSSSSTESIKTPSSKVNDNHDRVSQRPWLPQFLVLLLLGLALLTVLGLYFKFFNCVQLCPVRCGRSRCCFFFDGAERAEYKWQNKRCLALW